MDSHNDGDTQSKRKTWRLIIDNADKSDLKLKPPRPTCTRCGREMIQAFITAGDKTFASWLCDCVPQPATISGDIVRAREWDDEVLFYTIEYKPDGN